MSNQKWILSHGCWNGTVASRDIDQPKAFDSKEDAIRSLEDSEKFYKRIGYMVWFANLTSPDGKKTVLR